MSAGATTAVPVNRWTADGSGRAAVICGTTAWNGLGFTPHQVWAFRRAEIAAHAETPFRLTAGQRATMVHIRTLPPRAQGVERLAPLLRALAAPLLGRVAGLGSGARVAVVLSLAERFGDGGRLAAGADRLEAAVRAEAKAAGVPVTLQIVPRGHAGLAFALPSIGAMLAAGGLDAVVAGGVDTYYDAGVVDALVGARRLFDGENLEGFIPGEGGAFLLLARGDVAQRAGWPVAARLEAAASADEPAALDRARPMLGEGLTRTLAAVCEPLEAARRTVGWWISDLTHEPDRVREWQLAIPRATAGVSTPESVVELLPPLLGDLGAATLATAMVVAAEGFARGDPPARACVAHASSSGPCRGAVLLSK